MSRFTNEEGRRNHAFKIDWWMVPWQYRAGFLDEIKVNTNSSCKNHQKIQVWICSSQNKWQNTTCIVTIAEANYARGYSN